MKKKIKNSSGFTLVELLVVLTILAILSTMAVISYSRLQARARDSVKRTYLSELVIALEINKNLGSYTSLQPGQMSILQSIDPRGNAYCIAPSLLPDPNLSVPWEGGCPSGFEIVGPGIPTVSFTAFKVCAYQEQPDPGKANVFCKTGTLE